MGEPQRHQRGGRRPHPACSGLLRLSGGLGARLFARFTVGPGGKLGVEAASVRDVVAPKGLARMGSDGGSITAAAALARRPMHAQREWLTDQVSPLRTRIRTVGLLRAAPASFGLLLASLAATASVRLPSPVQHAASSIFVYRGRDLHTTTALYRLPFSALLAQSWPQWVWTAFVAVTLFASLEARVGPGRLLLCVFAGQVLSTALVDLIAGAGDRTAQL